MTFNKLVKSKKGVSYKAMNQIGPVLAHWVKVWIEKWLECHVAGTGAINR